MPSGIQVFNASGNKLLDTTDAVMTALGSASYNIGWSTINPGSLVNSGTIVNSDFAKGIPFYYIQQFVYSSLSGIAMDINISITGTTLTWSIPEAQRPTGASGSANYGVLQFIYGYY